MLKMMRDSFQHLKWILVAIVAIFILFIFVDWGAGGARVRPPIGAMRARERRDDLHARLQALSLLAEENYSGLRRAAHAGDLEQMALPSRCSIHWSTRLC